LVRVLNGTNKDHDDLKVGSDNHSLLICLLLIIVRSFLPYCFVDWSVPWRQWSAYGDCQWIWFSSQLCCCQCPCLDVQVGPFRSAPETLPHGEILVATGRGASGEIVTKSVELDGDSRVSEDDEDLNCKISKVHLHGDMNILLYFCYAWR
jgi:hypothetical protein